MLADTKYLKQTTLPFSVVSAGLVLFLLAVLVTGFGLFEQYRRWYVPLCVDESKGKSGIQM